MQINFPSRSFFQFDVAAARASANRTCDPKRAHIARSSLQTNLPGKLRQFHVSRTALQVDVSMRAFDNLIARAAVSTDRRLRRHDDFIVHRNIVRIHVINVNAVALLPQRRMLLNFAYVRVPVSEQPVVSDVDLAADRNRARRTAPHNDVAGVSLYFQFHRPADLKGFLERVPAAWTLRQARNQERQRRQTQNSRSPGSRKAQDCCR